MYRRVNLHTSRYRIILKWGTNMITYKDSDELVNTTLVLDFQLCHRFHSLIRIKNVTYI